MSFMIRIFSISFNHALKIQDKSRHGMTWLTTWHCFLPLGGNENTEACNLDSCYRQHHLRDLLDDWRSYLPVKLSQYHKQPKWCHLGHCCRDDPVQFCHQSLRICPDQWTIQGKNQKIDTIQVSLWKPNSGYSGSPWYQSGQPHHSAETKRGIILQRATDIAFYQQQHVIKFEILEEKFLSLRNLAV